MQAAAEILREQLRQSLAWLENRTQTQPVRELIATFKEALKCRS
jgi:hypothetical protein